MNNIQIRSYLRLGVENYEKSRWRPGDGVEGPGDGE